MFFISFNCEIQKRPDLRNSCIPGYPAQVEFCASRHSVCTWSTIYVRTGDCNLNPKSKTL